MSFAIPKAAALLLIACSRNVNSRAAGDADSGDTTTGHDILVVPEGLVIDALPGGNGVLDVLALTLRKGPGGAELYAALKNDGEVPACDASLSVELFDHSQQSIAAGIGGLFTHDFYRLTDGSGAIATCAGPGDVTMAALTDWSSDVDAEDVGYVVYRCTYYALNIAPIAGLIISSSKSVARDGGIAYTGTLVNDLDVPVSNPSVTVFPVNRRGRPLGVTTVRDVDAGSAASEIPPGNSWDFETMPVDIRVADYVAYPAGSLAR